MVNGGGGASGRKTSADIWVWFCGVSQFSFRKAHRNAESSAN